MRPTMRSNLARLWDESVTCPFLGFLRISSRVAGM
jgi:hypothetical protein